MPRLSKRVKALVTENMRSIILETSEKIIVRDGLEKLSIKQMAKEAEISPGSVYNYFKNKDEIISGIMRSAFHGLVNSMEEISGMDLPANEKLHKMALYIFEVFPRVYRLHEVLGHRQRHSKTSNGEEHPGHMKLMDILAGAIKQGVEDGDFIDCDPQFSAVAFWGMILEIKMNPGRLFFDAEPVELTEKVMKTFLQGIRKRSDRE